MDDGGQGGNVDETVKALPVLAAHGAQDWGGAGEGESKEDDPGGEAYLDEVSLFEVVEDGGPDLATLGEDLAGVAVAGGGEGGGEVVSGEEEEVGGEVEGGVEEGVEADEAAEADERGETGGETPEGSDGERAEEDPEGPISGEMGDVLDGVGVKGEGAVAVDEEQMGEWEEEKEMGKDL